MRILSLVIMILTVKCAIAAPTTVTLWADGAGAGDRPQGCTPAMTGGGMPAHWAAVTEPEAPQGLALAETSRDKTDARFPVCVYDNVTASNVDVSVRFRPVGGSVDQAGGIAVRFNDARNYYVARANALENNVRLYQMVEGVRRQVAGRDVKVAPGEWHTLRLRVDGDLFQVFFDDGALFEVRDGRIAGAGRVALWSKADSVTHFADLRVEVLP